MRQTPDAVDVDSVLDDLRRRGKPENLAGMKRYGIATENALGVSLPDLRIIARKTGRNHDLALNLWRTGIHEARVLAALVDDPAEVTQAQMNQWVTEIDSWDVCDGCCSNLFDKTPFAYSKAMEWSRSDMEYVKRAGFVMMAALAVHDKLAEDEKFGQFFAEIRKGAHDDRNHVRKGVNWALRGIGKRNARLNREAIKTAETMFSESKNSKSARWVATDALRELRGEAVQKRLRRSS